MLRPLIACAMFAALPAAAQDIPQTGNQWYVDAQAALQARVNAPPNTNRAKNVILMIADGNGIATNLATRLWLGQLAGGYGDDHVQTHEAFPHLGLAKTYNTNAQTPDSAGTATALMSGVKTRAGVIGVDETVKRGDCAAVEAGKVASIAEILAAQGKSVGIVSTARLTHATPAAAYAHAADRGYEGISRQPKRCKTPDIAVQLLDAMRAGIVDLALGGGRRHFLPKGITDTEGKPGKRTDGRDLIAEAEAAGIAYIWDATTAAQPQTLPVLGLFDTSHMDYEHDRANEPSLAQMTELAITALAANPQGYFVQIEAGRVDHANHAGNLYRAVTDGAAFEAAVARAAAMTDPSDTLIIVTADHDHVMALPGYCGRGSPVTGLCLEVDKDGERHLDTPALARDGKPYTVVVYANGGGSVLTKQSDGSYTGTRPAVTQEEATAPDYRQQALIPMGAETHSAVDVAIYARGPWAHLIDGTVEQNYIFHVMLHAAMVP